MVLQQPIHSIRFSAFLISGERQDEIATRPEALAMEPDERGDQCDVARLHVLRAATVEPAVSFDQLKWVGSPVTTASFTHIQMAHREDGFQPWRVIAVDARHQVPFPVVGSEYFHVSGRKA